MYKPLLIGAAVLLIAGATGYFYLAPSGPSAPATAESPDLPKLAYVSPPVPKAPPLAAPRTPPQGYREFRNEFYRFQVLYPQDMSATLTKEKGSAATIAFEGPGHKNDFQIFVVPYGGQQISEERFKLDEPSGVMEEPRDLKIDGTTARFFYGKDAALGETAEVWFINKGFLYEVTSYKSNGAWLEELMKGWMFL